MGKQLFPVLMQLLGRIRPVSLEHTFIESNTTKMHDAMVDIQNQFKDFAEQLSVHNGRILHMETTVESLLKERCCPVHGETVKVLDKMSDDIEHLKQVKEDIAGINQTLKTLKDMGVFHIHNKNNENSRT
jgi:predicted transcriptional regulator